MSVSNRTTNKRRGVIRQLTDEESSVAARCPSCDRPDVADRWMVQCDLCQRWFHFSCARVDESVRDRSFACGTCALQHGLESTRSTTSSTNSARRRLELLRLEEEKELQEKLLAEQVEEEAALQRKIVEEERERRKRIMQEKLDIAKRYINKKYEVLQEEERSNHGGSRKSHSSTRSKLSDVEKWVSNQNLALVTGSGTSQAPIGATPVVEIDPKITASSSCGGAVPIVSAQAGVSNASVAATGPYNLNNIASWGILVPRSGQGPSNSASVPPPSLPTTSSTPVQEKQIPRSTNHVAADISPPATTQQVGPAVYDMDISPPHVGERSRADLERELQELQQQLTNLKRSSSSQYHCPAPGGISNGSVPVTSLSNMADTGTSNLHDLFQATQDEGRQAQFPRSYPVGTQANVRFATQCTIQNTVPNTSFLPRWNPMVSSSRLTSNPPEVLNPSFYNDPNVLAGNLFQQYEPRISNPITRSTLSAEAPSYPFVASERSAPNRISQPVTFPVDITSRPFVASVPSVPNPIVTPVVSQRAVPDPSARHCGPSSQQIAARHVVPKELPEFAGDPIEWPLFVSSYNNSTRMCGYTDDENLMRLQRSLKGNAKEAVRGHLYHPSSVPQIMTTLETLYGRPELIVKCLTSKVYSTPAPKPDKLESLISFGLVVQNLCSQLQSMGMETHLSNPSLLQDLVDKLPANIKLDWAMYQRHVPVVDLRAFGTYMTTIVSAASKVTLYAEPSTKPEKPKGKEKGFVNAHSTEPDKEETSGMSVGYRPKPCLLCKTEGHKVRDCERFKQLTLANRWKTAHQLSLCRRCLIPHGKWPCKATVCGVANCEERHHKLLHPGDPQSSVTENTTPAINQPSSSATVNVHRQHPCPVLFRILPVTLYGKNASVNTLAFLDDGSSHTLIEKELADELGVEGEVEPLCLQWTGNIRRTESESQNIQLAVSAIGNDRKHSLDHVRTVENLDLPPQSLQYEEMARKFDYLKGIPVNSYSSAAPRILIGADNAKLLLTLKKREGKYCEPVAAKTRLGWTIYGKAEGLNDSPEHRLLHICGRSSDQQLHDAVKSFFSIENVGVALVPQVEADEDRRAREILEKTTIRTATGRFQTGLLWKFDCVEFPENRFMAERRLTCLERSLSKKPELYANVRQQILDYQAKGYAHKLTDEESNSSEPKKVWYLPLGVVQNPNKPGKVRVIWDAAAKTGGVSLNSMLLPGPDLLTSLPSVLFRFRQREVAVTGDIKEMFHQIIIRPEDRQAQRFLWRDNQGDPIQEYVMDVATFGSTCSPCSAQYVKNKNAEEWKQRYPEAAAAIVENTYVDDYANSADTVEEAVRVALEVKEIHASAGFVIRNWLSNSGQVLLRVGEQGSETTKTFSVGKSADAERVLGITWLPEYDSLMFAAKFRPDIQHLLDEDTIPTKREVLRVVMSIFDPLGLVAAFVVHGKCLIQDIWRAGVDWDDQIPPEIVDQWRRWVEVLRNLDHVKIPRCYFPGYDHRSLQSLELHVFVDASEAAYASAAYFRIVDRGHVRCALVAAKTKVAPLKPMSVPRLELQAAVIGVRLMKSIQEHHTLPISRRVIWGDSKTVQSWIRSDQRKYRQFVAFRVSEILSETNADEWRWVPTRLNVADEATKWGKGPCFQTDSRWFVGPEFLYKDESEWPIQESSPPDTSEEMRVVHAHHRVAPESLIQYHRFSKYQRLLRTVGFVLRFIDSCRRRFDPERRDARTLSKEELLKAEVVLWKLVQAEEYSEELTTVRKNAQLSPECGKRLEKSSPLRKLSVFLDEQGVLRIEGRIGAAKCVPYGSKFPVILPKKHRFTELLVEFFHQRYAHGFGETVTNELRQIFYIPSLRTVVRKVARSCPWCTVYRAVPKAPRMAPLPAVRVTPYVRPFTFIGIDYCGPFMIRIGRSNVKRWVVLITCLTVRAVHLEIASSMSSESCKMAIRRFIARRGAPQEIYSDQGTNFVGASKELQAEVAAVNRVLAGSFTNRDTQWWFNPPAAPHMGGVWERLVRTVKTSLDSLSISRTPDEETFNTLLIEVEGIINSRPLTSNGVCQPPQIPAKDSGRSLRANWDQVRCLLDEFWSKWIKGYLPTICRRTKWFDDTKPINVGDLVFIVDEGMRNSWTRGKVVKAIPGSDGRVRRVEVQTNNGVFQRPVTKVAVLDVAVKGTAENDHQQYGSGNVGE
ncbi:uncharacterized protein LOC134285955 [Aedes albopictus]|uniref:Pro-Pol polyprotein n=1 Tax=Aedes albopictus TaxID=7160 RepID=A0ABM1ZD87_AEDAL